MWGIEKWIQKMSKCRYQKEKAVNIVVASCVLYNICIQKGDINRESYDHIPLHCNVNPNQYEQRENHDSSTLLGKQKRERIRNSLNAGNVTAFSRRRVN